MSNFRKQNNKKNLSYYSPLNNYKIIIQNNYYTENSNKILPVHENINSSKNINPNNKNLIKLSNNFLYTKRNNKCPIKNKSYHSHSNSNNIIKLNNNQKHESLINNYLKNIVISQNFHNNNNNTMKRSNFSKTVKQLKPKKNFDLSEKDSYIETDIGNLNNNSTNSNNNKINLQNKLKNFFKKNIPLSSSNSKKNLNKLLNQNKNHKKNKSMSSSNKIIITNKILEDKNYNYNSNNNLTNLSSNNDNINKILYQNINQIKSPEELHFFFVNTIQKGKNLEQNFEL